MTGNFGAFLRFSWQVMFDHSSPRILGRWSRLSQQLDLIGTRSAPVLADRSFIAVLAIEGTTSSRRSVSEQRLGAVVNISVVKQIGPVLAAVMLAGRVVLWPPVRLDARDRPYSTRCA